MSTKMSFLASIFFLGILLQHVVVAIDHQVGGDFGWNLPPTPTFFSEWASNKTFFVNDKLIIKSRAHEAHDIAQPETEADFDGCVQPRFVSDFNVFIVLNRSGRCYFISTMGNDCKAGMKFVLDVVPSKQN